MTLATPPQSTPEDRDPHAKHASELDADATADARARKPQRDGTEGPLEDELDAAFNRLVDEGTQRLGRSWTDVLITGFFGGTEIGVGVLALVLIYYETDNILLGGLGFSLGFIALLLARSELFTEAFLVPIISVAAKRARTVHLAKLWGGVLVANLVGGWAMMWLIVWAYPDMHDVINELALGYLEAGLSLEGVSLALLGGAAITLMTRMQSGSAEMLPKIVAAVAVGFLLGAGHLYHLIVGSLLLFGSIHIGFPDISYVDWLGWFWWVLIANMVGGLVLVTMLRLIRSKERLGEERNRVLKESLTPGPVANHADGRQQIERERREQRKEENREAERKVRELDDDEKADRFKEAGPHRRDDA
ncbi:formate/nitrite transporter family protein [Nocardioidaceae bacterium]|nr:formate/nitrite transporter family protein [Nocardioidaceae bacterium]